MGNLAWGLQISALGMGLVFGLLAVLWGLLTLVLRFERPAPVTQAKTGAQSRSPGQLSDEKNVITPDLAAAITMAVLRHKTVRRLEAAPGMRAYLPGSQLYASRWVASGRTRQNRSWHRSR